jgi:hypothetical protein
MGIYNTTHHNALVSWTRLIRTFRSVSAVAGEAAVPHVAQLSIEEKRVGRMKGSLGGRVGVWVGSSLPTSDALVGSVSAQR